MINPYLLIFLTATSFGCVKRTPSPVASRPIEQESGGHPGNTAVVSPSLPIVMQQNMTTVKVAIGQTTSIQFEDPNIADYTWYYDVSQDWIISMTEPYDYPSKSAAPPKTKYTVNPATQKIFDVKGLKKGGVPIATPKLS